MSTQERQLVEAARQLLNRSVADLDPEVVSRLARAREKALAGQRAPQRILLPSWPMFGLTATALATVALVVVLATGIVRQDPAERYLVAEIGLFLAEETVDFFEDIEFYEWLATDENGEETFSGRGGAFVHPDAAGLGRRSGGGAGGRNAGPGAAGVPRII